MERFQRQIKSHSSKTHHWTVADRAVNLTLAGEEMAFLTRPLEHHEPHIESTPDLSIYAWAGPAGDPLTAIPWRQESQEDSVGLSTERFRINYHEPSSLLCMWDRQDKKAIYWAPRAANLPFWEIASPFRILYHWWAQSWGGQVAHAAAVGVDGHGLLLIGKSGSGKSTAALTCLRQGLDFVGDDYILLTTDPMPQAHSLYSSAKMHDETLEKFFPDWTVYVGARVGPEAKGVLFLRDLPGIRLRSTLKLLGIVAPQRTDDIFPTITPASPGSAWLALVPSTVFQLPDCRQNTMAFFSAFMRRMQNYSLKTGRDPECIPGVLRTFLTTKGKYVE